MQGLELGYETRSGGLERADDTNVEALAVRLAYNPKLSWCCVDEPSPEVHLGLQ